MRLVILPLGPLACEDEANSWFTRAPHRYYILLVEIFERASLRCCADYNSPLKQGPPLQCQGQTAEDTSIQDFGSMFQVMCEAFGLSFQGSLTVC